MKIMSLDYKKDFWKIFGIASAVCLLGIFIAYLPFILRGNYLAWCTDTNDGVVQHCTFLDYILSCHGLDGINSIDFNIGLGDDYFLSFAYYMIFDPFVLIFYYCNPNNIEVLYTIIVVLKLITIFIVMFLFLKHKNMSPIVAIIGAFCYLFAGTTIFSVPRHPMFATGIIYLPLIIWGIENIFDGGGKRPYLLLVSIVIACLSNYYQFIIISIFAVIYSVIYYFKKFPIKTTKFQFKNFIRYALIVGGWYLLGILISTFVLLPVGYQMLSSARGSSKGFTTPSISSYFKILCNYFAPTGVGNYNKIGLTIPIMLLAFYYLGTCKNSYSVGLLALIAGSFSILFGYATNMFNYYSGRWLFCLVFYIIMIASMSIQDILDNGVDNTAITKTFRYTSSTIILGIALAMLIALGKLLIMWNANVIIYVLSIILILSLLVFTFIKLVPKIREYQWFKKLFSPKLLLPLLIIFSLSQATIFNFTYSKSFDNGAFYNSLVTTDEQFVSNSNANKFFRTDISDNFMYSNTSLNNDYMSTRQYNSSFNGNVYEFLTKNALDYNTTLGISNLDGRASYESLFNVNYVINRDVKSLYGFSKVEGQDHVYYNNNVLNFGTIFESTMSYADYERLPLQERVNVITEALIIDSDNSSYDYQDKLTRLDYDISIKNATVKDNVIIAEKNATITLTVSGCENSEFYIKFDNLTYSSNALNNLVSGKSSGSISISNDNITKDILLRPIGHQMYNANTDRMFNLGYKTDDTSTITLELTAGTYSYDEFGLYAYDMDIFQTNIDRLKGNSLTLDNFTTLTNNIKGSITLENEGYLFLSIPYSEGWTAKVDGKDATILKANHGFMAIKLDRGYHTIELNYSTPMLTVSIIISVSALIVSICLVVYLEIRHRKKRTEINQ